jgi:hypothetical protein
MKRYLGTFLLSAALLGSVGIVKADDDYSRPKRYYDRDGRDYHVYNQQEDRAYRGYLAEKHYEYRALPKLSRERQREYWKWRHVHPDVAVVVRP